MISQISGRREQRGSGETLEICIITPLWHHKGPTGQVFVKRRVPELPLLFHAGIFFSPPKGCSLVVVWPRGLSEAQCEKSEEIFVAQLHQLPRWTKIISKKKKWIREQNLRRRRLWQVETLYLKDASWLGWNERGFLHFSVEEAVLMVSGGGVKFLFDFWFFRSWNVLRATWWRSG